MKSDFTLDLLILNLSDATMLQPVDIAVFAFKFHTFLLTIHSNQRNARTSATLGRIPVASVMLVDRTTKKSQMKVMRLFTMLALIVSPRVLLQLTTVIDWKASNLSRKP